MPNVGFVGALGVVGVVVREDGDPRGEDPLFLGDRLVGGLDMAVFGLITCDDRETRERDL